MSGLIDFYIELRFTHSPIRVPYFLGCKSVCFNIYSSLVEVYLPGDFHKKEYMNNTFFKVSICLKNAVIL